MKKFEISNWTKGTSVEVWARAARPGSSVPSLIGICQDACSMHFQFDMRPAQARELAAALVSAAEEAERAA